MIPGGTSSSVTLTRTADTADYIANDVVGAATGSTAALTFEAAGFSSREMEIIGSELMINRSAVIAGETSYLLHLYRDTPPSVLGDNVAFDVPAGDRTSYLGSINLGTPLDLGSTLYISNEDFRKPIRFKGPHVYAYLVTVGPYTPQSATVHVITLHLAAV